MSSDGAGQLKILIFMDSLAGGGAERAAATLANYWVRKGWDVTLVTLAPIDDDFYPLDPGIQRIALALAGDSGHLAKAVCQNIRRIMALRRVLLQVRPRIALAMMSTPNVLLACASRGIAGLSTIGSERCYPPHAPIGRAWNTLRKTMYGRLSAVVALTRECAAWVEGHTAARCVRVIPNAIAFPLPDNIPRLLPMSLCAPTRKVLLAVGRLDAVKNIDALLHAFAQLAHGFPEWDLVILGEGPQRPQLEAAIRSKLLGQRVFLPGIAGNVGDWYARASLFAMTSLSEGFPNALAEALAHGVPAVGVDCDTGPRDIIRHEVDGLLVPPGDPAALVAALAGVMGDVALRTRLALRAGDAAQRFSLGKVAAMWESLFDEVSAPDLQAQAQAQARAQGRRGAASAERAGP